ncbi:MAG: 23S rRNA (uracil(1939)-C(5))-methyltransferase RlmD [Chlamydiia bacterium]|nr:23S rRNA (uracil(1939)-C(5))-methyltransferase RlmD [Chlamydiia bacterium]
MKKDKTAELTVDRLTKKGWGRGERLLEDGSSRPIDVPYSIPGERVKVKLLRRNLGEIEELITPSPLRQEGRCVHFGACGGCRWQHIPYERQTEEKQKWVENLFNATVQPIIPCPQAWAYRNKMEWTFSQDREGNRYLGLYLANRANRVLNVIECHLVHQWFAETLAVVRAWWEETGVLAYYPPLDRGTLRTLTMREGIATGDRQVILTVSGNPNWALKKKDLNQFVSRIKAHVGEEVSILLTIQQIAKGQPTRFYEMLLNGRDTIRETLLIQPTDGDPFPLHFQISPMAFFQPNSKQAATILSKVLQLGGFTADDIVYDLYCGGGALGMTVARFVNHVYGMEIVEEACLDAKENQKINQLTNYTMVTGSVPLILEKQLFPNPTAVIIDPPRAGCDEKTLELIISLHPKKVIYVSCHPETQARDVTVLQEKGYQIQVIQPIDQFPQTVHLENIVVLHAL